ncbi:MAG: Brp/Blh family beta-carotene 15,15'-dioxygenase [Trueperaceae bacterium]|nr:Brp/Blh family beta-carotene 15,15'-dioxygenase [Trueperaceae bacterium]
MTQLTFGSATLGSRSQNTAALRLVPLTTLVPWFLTTLLLLVHLAAPGIIETYALYPLLLGIILLGLPHGALDHLVPARLGLAWGRRPLGLALYLLAYVGIAALYFALWVWQPLIAFVGFLLATVWHWGQGDMRYLEIFLGRDRPSQWGAGVTLLLRGALPMAVPVLAFPDTAESLYYHAARGLGAQATGLNLSHPGIVYPLVGFLGVLFVLYLVNAVRAAPNRAVLLIDGLELLLLVALFSLIPAYMAIGAYFIFWHSLRHLARLLLLRPKDEARLANGEWAKPLRRLTLDLLPITVAAIGLLIGVYFFNAARITSLEGFVALYLVLISALTKPHLLVVAMMDLVPSGYEDRAPQASSRT